MRFQIIGDLRQLVASYPLLESLHFYHAVVDIGMLAKKVLRRRKSSNNLETRIATGSLSAHSTRSSSCAVKTYMCRGDPFRDTGFSKGRMRYTMIRILCWMMDHRRVFLARVSLVAMRRTIVVQGLRVYPTMSYYYIAAPRMQNGKERQGVEFS